MIYEDVFRELNKKRIKYMVVGGLAVNLHGFPRTTLDLDLTIALTQQNKEDFYGVMKKLKYKTKKCGIYFVRFIDF